MVCEWKEYSLGEIAENTSRPFNFSGRESVIFINTGDVLKGEFLHTNRSIPKGLPGQAKKKIVEGDILFSEIRPANGRYAEVTFDADDYVVSTKFMVIRLTTKKVFQPFFLIQLTSEQTLLEFQRIAESRSGTFPQITFDSISYYPFVFPPLPEQKAIAHILGSLDDKIELNRRMNETLEGMAQALFKSWFVDFDPVIDNALEAGNPIPEEFADRAEIRRQALADGTANREAAKNFPSAFQEADEMGWIPEGWELQPLYDMANFINGAAYKENDFSESPDALPVIKIAEIKGGITAQTKFTEVNKGEKYKIEDGEILLSWSGNPDTSIDTFIWSNGAGYLNQHIFKVSLYDEADRYFVYYQLKFLRSIFAEIARDKQTTGLGHFTAGDMKRLMVFKPENELLTLFNEVVESLYQRSYENCIATKTLTKLRDTLLPKLISGELRIEAAEKMVGEVL